MFEKGIYDVDGSGAGSAIVGPILISATTSCSGPSSVVVVVGEVVVIAVKPLAYGSSMNVLSMGGGHLVLISLDQARIHGVEGRY